ncbi:hypothetical protein [Bradyrhizobium sp. UNPA324]|uniref:hypothetical protein n=1 Tax=Bradyrhizobium sp. UNPA324 TaxID=1141174 RepID=UPI00114DAF8B|nr:hypothetical protein [Bradyrhizobium sp. UNPA324]TQF28798.1 hypothetical protein UNPA324_03380 [Bradyrhizobium sp. UNPA324]
MPAFAMGKDQHDIDELARIERVRRVWPARRLCRTERTGLKIMAGNIGPQSWEGIAHLGRT